MLSLKIALRYILARKSHSAVNIIALISVGGVAVAVAAMVVVLSIYNGFEELSRRKMSRLDPQLKIERTDGRMIDNADSLAAVVGALPEIAAAAPTITERGLLVSGQYQKPVVFRGIDAGYNRELISIDSLMEAGVYAAETSTGYPAAQVAVGVANEMLINPLASPIAHLYVPRRVGRINPANPAAAFREQTMMVSGVFRVDDQDVDADNIIIPLDVAREILDYSTQATAIEVNVGAGASEADINGAAARLAAMLGDSYTVRDRLEQRREAFRMIAVEKWVTFMMLVMVLIIALFNIVSTVSLMIIEKRDNMRTLRALGATEHSVGSIFAAQGMLITVFGGIVGIVVGVALSFAQQYGRFIKLSGAPGSTVVDAYPVQVSVTDILAVAASVTIMSVLMAAVARLLAHRALR